MLLDKTKVGLLTLLTAFIAPVLGSFWELTGDYVCHDPSIIKEESTWFTFCTGDGIQVLYSNDGTTWARAAQIFLSELSWWNTYVPDHAGSIDVWAPDVQLYNGRVWMYYSISTFGSKVSAIGLASATSISAGSWRDDGVIMTSTGSNDYNCIDPNLVLDKDGNPWLAFGSFWSGIKITKLDPSTMKPTGSIYSIAANPSTTDGAIEAPSIIYRDGYYYLFASIDYCCKGVNSTYKIVYSRATSITGPYYDKDGNDALQTSGTVLDTGNDRWKGPGGEDVYDNVIVRHAYDATDNGTPKLLINDLSWSDGWPTY
ncbi:glycosyl hydrolase [Dichotomocladium elegans]|nr:glycosyl hydrolase [Dichotomocladium elegans]